jgi:HK97 family phage major capsid protein
MKKSYLIVGLLLAACAFSAVASVVPESHALAAHMLSTSLDPSTWLTGMVGMAAAMPAVTSKNLRNLQGQKAALVKSMRELNDKAAAENRDLTAEEQTAFDGHKSKLESLNARIERETTLMAEEADAGVEIGEILSTHERGADDPKRGFRTFGEFAAAARQHPNFQGSGVAMNGQLIQAAAPSTYGSEASGVDGGFAVPPAFAREIFTLSLTEDALLPFTDDTPVEGNSMVFPKDETTPWGTDGIRAYWQAEAAAATATKPKLGTEALRLHKLMALVPVTDELMADTNALGAYIPKKVADSIRWKTNEAILNGTGAGQPLGALTSAAGLQVSKDSGQATLTLSAANLANMIARLPPGSYGRAIWLINNDVLGALFTLTLGNYPIYIPAGAGNAGGIQGNPYGMLLGRPIVISQHAASFTSAGDVQLHDLSYYRTITKSGGVETATSMHLYFDADVTAYRTTFRIDGKPKIAAQISPANGTNKMSPFLKLQAR